MDSWSVATPTAWTPLPLTVIDSSPSHLRLEADRDDDTPDEPYLDLELHGLVSESVDLLSPPGPVGTTITESPRTRGPDGSMFRIARRGTA